MAKFRSEEGLVTVEDFFVIVRSQALKGFWLDVEWLFADPLPHILETFQGIVHG